MSVIAATHESVVVGTNPVLPVLLRFVHKLVNADYKGLHVFVQLILPKPDAHRIVGY